MLVDQMSGHQCAAHPDTLSIYDLPLYVVSLDSVSADVMESRKSEEGKEKYETGLLMRKEPCSKEDSTTPTTALNCGNIVPI